MAKLRRYVVENVAPHNTFRLAPFPAAYVISHLHGASRATPQRRSTGKGGNDGYDPSAERSHGASVIRVHRCNRARNGLVGRARSIGPRKDRRRHRQSLQLFMIR